MSTLLEPSTQLEEAVSFIDKDFKPKIYYSNRRLKSKENIFKHKYHRELRKKLKKYRLRRDGQEDPEVLNVSQILVTSLKIKSPNNNTSVNGVYNVDEELRPKNYLFRMGRKTLVVSKKKVGVGGDSALITNNIEDGKSNVTSIVNANENINMTNAIENHDADTVKATLDKNEIDREPSEKSRNKKKTNAFTFMMDSRNKSIGSNSPGKEKTVDEIEQQDIIEKKSIKAKRNLLLQKMAEAKGSLKNKEIEEHQEKIIKKKMEKRAERLKKMINRNDSKPAGKIDISLPKNETITTMTINGPENLSSPPQKHQIKLVFNDLAKAQNIPTKKVTKEEDEFLQKLSPSLKKKENMLCYFKKVEKDQDDIFGSQDSDDNTPVIKVKLKSKGKNKIKKKKLSLNKGGQVNNQDENCDSNRKVAIVETPQNKKQKKKIHSVEVETKDLDEKPLGFSDQSEFDIARPRRNVKRPAKYIDDMHITSSDEELHIFTPKKKKHADQQNKRTLEIRTNKDETKSNKVMERKDNKSTTQQTRSTKLNKDVMQPKKQTKLAPIFALKPQQDAAAIEAKQKFLSSGVPDKLKKYIDKQTSKTVGMNYFHTVVHVQQNQMKTLDVLDKVEIVWSQNCQSDEETDKHACEHNFFKKMLKCRPKTDEPNLIIAQTNRQIILQSMKQLYPKFPVYRTYRLLKDKNRGEFKDLSYLDLDNSIEVINGMIDINNGSPDRLSWTDKYKAMSSKQIIGNYESIKEIKKWLISWTENDTKRNANSDSSDFYTSDTDSKDSMKSTNNLLILNGPIGSGKTSLVYAVAAELAIKVLEVNASNKRTGKIMLQDLQEATQSHKVNRGKSSQELSQKSQEIIDTEKAKVKKRGRPKKDLDLKSKQSEKNLKKEVLSQQTSSSQESARTCMSLILIDDADIVFEQDDGFCAAIVQLVQCSKRPVILITSSTSCPHLQRFLQCAKIIHTRPLFPKMLGTWLDIMCLADSGTCSPGLGAKCLDYFKGDIRKSINFLQFQMAKSSTGEESISQNADNFKASIEDENSNMSWSERESSEDKNENNKIINNGGLIWQNFMRKEASLLSFKHPINVFRVWWNIPRLLIPQIDYDAQSKNLKLTNKQDLDILSRVADMISATDFFCPLTNNLESELFSFPWVKQETHSVSELECLDKYNKNNEVANEISHSLLSGSIIRAQEDLGIKSETDLQFPELATRREKDRVTDRHNKLSSFLSPSAVLDRRALALDYWSGCRSICRVEKTRTDSNSKRNNRFCHYLKSANILCKSDSFDNLANSLYCAGE